MTQNLKTRGIEIYPTDSDVQAVYNIPSSCSNFGQNDYDQDVLVDNTGDVWYGKKTASAGNFKTFEGNSTGETSICPISWKIPTKNEFEVLLQSYNNQISEIISGMPNFSNTAGSYCNQCQYHAWKGGAAWWTRTGGAGYNTSYSNCNSVAGASQYCTFMFVTSLTPNYFYSGSWNHGNLVRCIKQ